MANRSAEEIRALRSRILQAAFELFCEQGIEKTAVAHIAKRAGVSRSSIYAQFGSREEVLSALCLHLGRRTQLFKHLVAAGRPEEPDPLGRLCEALLLRLTPEEHMRQDSLVMHFIESAALDAGSTPILKAEYAGLLKARQEHLRQGLYQAVVKGQLPQNLKLDFAAALLNSLIFAQINFHFLGDKSLVILDKEEGVRQLAALLRRCCT